MKKLFLLAVFGLLACFSASAQNYNFNIGALQYSSGPSIPTSCFQDGYWFFKNTAPTGWSYCSGGLFVSGSTFNGAVFAGSGNTVQQTMTSAGVNGLSFVYPNYAGVDIPSGTRIANLLNPTISSQSNRSHLFDYRFGGTSDVIFNPGYDGLTNTQFAREVITNYSNVLLDSINPNNVFAEAYQTNILNGTQNAAYNSYTNKTNVGSLYLQSNTWTNAQQIALISSSYMYGNGDSLAASLTAIGTGSNANTDEGVEALDMSVTQWYVEPAGTIASGASTGATSLTLTLTAGSGSQHQGGTLYDITQVYNSGTISSITGSGVAAAVVGSATAWTGAPFGAASTTTTTSAAITVPGGGALTPGSVNIQVGNSAGFDTSHTVCVADAATFEYVIPSAVPDGTHITAIFTLPHASGATVATGGMCGYVMEIVADTWTSATPQGFVTPTPPLRQLWPIISSSSATAANIWISVAGVASSYAGMGAFPGAAYKVYPAAQVTAVNNSGPTVSNTVTLSPNRVPWANGDSVAEANFPTEKVGVGNWQINQFHAAQSVGTGSAGVTYNGVWNSPSQLWTIRNNTLNTLYLGAGGQLTPPYGFRLTGASSFGLLIDQQPSAAALTVGCPVNSGGNIDCTLTNVFTANHTQYIIQAGIGDVIAHSAGNKQWVFTSQSNTTAIYLPVVAGIVNSNAAGQDIPIEVGFVSCTQANCASSATTLYNTPAADSLYRADVSVACSTSTATATGQVTITYTDVSNTVQTFTSTTATCTTLGAASVGTATVSFSAKASTAIQYSVTQANAPAGLRARVGIFQESTN